MTHALRVGVVQLASGIDPAANAAAVAEALRTAATQHAQIAFTPEMSGLLDRDRTRLLGHAHAGSALDRRLRTDRRSVSAGVST